MAQSGSDAQNDDFFNDLSQQPNNGGDISPTEESSRQNASGENDERSAQPKAKRIACILCRKRKLRCDGARPTCGTCKRLSHDCAYDEVRKKSGPKRGYVKLLEARLQQVETLLKTQDPNEAPRASSSFSGPSSNITATQSIDPMLGQSNLGTSVTGSDHSQSFPGQANQEGYNMMDTSGSVGQSNDSTYSWEVIGLGLEEPLPASDVINELHQLYFEKVHPSAPMIHRPRYLAAMNLAPNMRPPICLRYMMWCLASACSDKYESLTEIFYYRAKKYAHLDEMKGHGESMITLAHCQTWLLISLYEFKCMYFPRAWLSVGRGARAAQMMMLHRLDGTGLDVKQCLAPPRDWTEREERRRTFWMAFCEDRYASIGTGWPMTIDEKDIMTNLPTSEEAFDKSKPEPTLSLDQALKPGGVNRISPISGVILMATLFGRNLHHLHRPTPEDMDDNLDGAFWKRHRNLEGILANIALTLPDYLRLPGGLPDPNVIFMNMAIHTSAICLHQAAIFKADRHRLPPNVSSESRVRCVTAAAETARIMRMIVHLDLITMNPFLAFCLYVAARVFVQYLKFRPKDQPMIASLHFLLDAMHALKRKNPLTESFLVQLDVDLEGAGIDVGQRGPNYSKPVIVREDIRIRGGPGGLLKFNNPPVQAEIPQNTDSVKCSPLFEIRDSQQPMAEVNKFHQQKPATTQPPQGNSPGPPFHVAKPVNFDMDPTNFDYLGGINANNSYQLPARGKLPPDGSGPRIINLSDSLTPPSDMDKNSPVMTINESNSRSNSVHNSGFSPASHITPPSDGDPPHGPQRQPSQTGPSPMGISSTASNMPTPGTAGANVDFMSTLAMDSDFSNLAFQPNFMNFDDATTYNLQGWGVSEMSGVESNVPTGLTPGATGLTPVGDAQMNWSQMLDGIPEFIMPSEHGGGAGRGF